MKSLAPILASPIVCLAMLGGMTLENRARVKPEDADAYHKTAKEIIEAWPTTIKAGENTWTSRSIVVPDAAVELLHPNVILCREYTCQTSVVGQVDLLIVQCREPSDMSGHYPPNCYPAAGERLSNQKARVWQVRDVAVEGMEYNFDPKIFGTATKCVYNFFVLPGRGIVPDMRDVQRASSDYQHRYFGAAQFQVVFYKDLPQSERDAAFVEIISANPGIFQALNP